MFPQVLAEFDDEGVYIYQAFKDRIVDAALEHGRFSTGFTLDRMTWIKPSFGWMLHRSKFATKRRQTRIVKVKVAREGFDLILAQAIPTHFDPEIFASESEWGRALNQGEVRYQWDPDRDASLQKTGGRAIQLGISGSIVRRYVEEWTLSIEDVTELAHALGEASRQRRGGPAMPPYPVYPVGAETARTLGMREQEPW